MKATTLASVLLAISFSLGSQSMLAQSQEEKDALINAVGSDAGEALFSVHFAVNALAENWQKNVYADFQAKELAASYKGSAEKVLGLVKGKSTKVEEGAGLLLKQATVLEAWIQTKEGSLADSYRKLKAEADAILFPSAASPRNSEVEAEIRQIAESLREDFGKATQWKPDASQINSLSRTLNDAEKLRAYAETLYASLPAGQSAAKPGQTEILVTGPDLADLPGGYSAKLHHFREGVEIYGFKYVEPGKTTGMAYDGLFRKDGQWFFLPKAWRAFGEP